jgi:ubiquinone/menaquinone biosynthesis C-methylase UbiE
MVNKKYIGRVDPDYLQNLASRVKPLKKRSYELMNIKNGDRILDIGCGPGIDTIPLSQFVGSTGQVIGIDIDPEMIYMANKKAQEENVTDIVLHKHFDAESIPYNSNYFDSCHSERLLQHLLTPWRTISEMVRVTKPDGWIVVSDTDQSTFSIDSPDIDIEWKLRRFHTEIFKNGYIGRQLYRLFKEENLADIIIEIFPLFSTDYKMTRYIALLDKTESQAISTGIITEEELERWHTNLEKSNKEGKFFSNVSLILIAGRKVV